MSMISAQIDELREYADRADGTFPLLASALRDAADTIWQLRDDLQRANAENAELREQMERLVTLLRVDCDIDASWDGLRRFWSIGLTENGCLMRDRACKAEAENVKLREQIHWLKQGDILHVLTDQEYIDQCERERLMQVSIDALDKDNAKLRELVRLMVRRHAPISPCKNIPCGECPVKDECDQEDAIMRELGIEVDDG